MKKLFLIAAICFTSHICLAQITPTLVVAPQPPAALISWGVKDLTYIINAQSTGTPSKPALVKAELKASDGTIAATTNLARARSVMVGNGTVILYAADVIPLDVMIFNGKYKNSIERTG